MKTLNKILTLFVAIIIGALFNSCDNEDYLVFTASEPSQEINFLNTLEPSYKLSEQTLSNIAERLIWSQPDFGAPTPNVYVAEMSINSDFSSVDWSSGDISENFIAVYVSELMSLAELQGMVPGDSGVVYGRVTAYAGSSSASASVSSTSDTVSVNIEILESGACDDAVLSTWGLVGDAVNGWGGVNQGFSAGNDIPFVSAGSEGLYVAAVTFLNGQWKIRKDNDWGVNFGDNGADGTLEAGGNNIVTGGGSYYVSFDETNSTYSVTSASDIWGIVGDGTFNGWGGPNVKMVPDPCNDGVFLAYGVSLTQAQMKFRLNDDWGVNLGDNGADGSLEAGGANIVIPAAGTYNITLDTVNNTYSLVQQ